MDSFSYSLRLVEAVLESLPYSTTSLAMVEMRCDVVGALRRVPQPWRKALVLRYVYGYGRVAIERRMLGHKQPYDAAALMVSVGMMYLMREVNGGDD